MTINAGAGAGGGGPGGSGSGAGGDGGSGADQDFENKLNAVVQSHLRRVLPKAISESLGGALKPIEERLAALQPKPEEKPAGSDAAGQQKPAEDPRITQLMKQHEALKKELDGERDLRTKSEQARVDAQVSAELRDALTGKVRPETQAMAVRILRADGKVKPDANGKAVFVDADGVEQKLDEGLKAWLKTQEGLVFVPAPSPAQNGKKGGSFTPRRGADGNPIAEKPADRAGRVLGKMGITSVT